MQQLVPEYWVLRAPRSAESRPIGHNPGLCSVLRSEWGDCGTIRSLPYLNNG
jgi:hypothetical protein